MNDDPVLKVRKFLDDNNAQNIEIKIIEGSIFTVSDAAHEIGVAENEILKSLIVLVDKVRPCLVLMSGANQIDAKKIAHAFNGKRSHMMPPDEIFKRYGFKIGGVPSVGYSENLPAVLDEDLFNFKIVWSAAGTDD